MATKTKAAAVNTQWFEIADLHEAPYNARSITQAAAQGLTESLERFGLLALPVVNTKTKKPTIVGGHQRIRRLKEKGVTRVLCITVAFDAKTEKRANFALNNKAIQGDFLPELTQELLSKLRENGDEEIKRRLERLNLDNLMKTVSRKLTEVDPKTLQKTVEAITEGDDEEPVESVKKTRSQSKLNTFYKLGHHVIFCGQPDKAGTLKGFPQQRARMCLMHLASEKPFDTAYVDTLLGHAMQNTDGVVAVATNTDRLCEVQSRYTALKGYWSNCLIWEVENRSPRPGDPYRDALIPVVYGWPEGSDHVFVGGSKLGNVDTCRQKGVSLPVEVAVKLMLWCSLPGAAVLDVNAGSGSTLIAAERTDRILMGYVATPAQCDHVRRRWAQFKFGKGAAWTSKTPAKKV